MAVPSVKPHCRIDPSPVDERDKRECIEFHFRHKSGCWKKNVLRKKITCSKMLHWDDEGCGREKKETNIATKKREKNYYDIQLDLLKIDFMHQIIHQFSIQLWPHNLNTSTANKRTTTTKALASATATAAIIIPIHILCIMYSNNSWCNISNKGRNRVCLVMYLRQTGVI